MIWSHWFMRYFVSLTTETSLESLRESQLIVRRQDCGHRVLHLRGGIHPLAHLLDASHVSNQGEEGTQSWFMKLHIINFFCLDYLKFELQTIIRRTAVMKSTSSSPWQKLSSSAGSRSSTWSASWRRRRNGNLWRAAWTSSTSWESRLTSYRRYCRWSTTYLGVMCEKIRFKIDPQMLYQCIKSSFAAKTTRQATKMNSWGLHREAVKLKLVTHWLIIIFFRLRYRTVYTLESE